MDKRLAVPDVGLGHCRYHMSGRHRMIIMKKFGDNIIFGCKNTSWMNLQECPLAVNTTRDTWAYMTAIGVKYQMEKSLEELLGFHGTL